MLPYKKIKNGIYKVQSINWHNQYNCHYNKIVNGKSDSKCYMECPAKYYFRAIAFSYVSNVMPLYGRLCNCIQQSYLNKQQL